MWSSLAIVRLQLTIDEERDESIGVVPDCACGELRALPALLAPLLLPAADPDAGVERQRAGRDDPLAVRLPRLHLGRGRRCVELLLPLGHCHVAQRTTEG